MQQFFAFRLQERELELYVLLYSRRLLQQLIVNSYTMIESGRLKYIRHNQKKLRAHQCNGLADAVSRGVSSKDSIRQRFYFHPHLLEDQDTWYKITRIQWQYVYEEVFPIFLLHLRVILNG